MLDGWTFDVRARKWVQHTQGGRRVTTKGVTHAQARQNRRQRQDDILLLKSQGMNQTDIAHAWGISRQRVSQIMRERF